MYVNYEIFQDFLFYNDKMLYLKLKKKNKSIFLEIMKWEISEYFRINMYETF